MNKFLCYRCDLGKAPHSWFLSSVSCVVIAQPKTIAEVYQLSNLISNKIQSNHSKIKIQKFSVTLLWYKKLLPWTRVGDLLTAVVDGRDDGEANANELIREAQMKITTGRAPTKAFTMMENSPQKS